MAQTLSSPFIPRIRSGVAIRTVPFDAPWEWLAAGWRDLWSVPRISLAYGAVFALAALGLAVGLLEIGWASLMLALGGGFVLIGPLAAVGLYEASRRLEQGQAVTLREVLSAGQKAPGQLAFFGVVLAFVFFVWMELAFLSFMLFMGTRGLPPPSEFVPMLLFTPHGLGLLVVGTLIGGILASIVFAISAISVPLMMTKRVDAVTAMATSVEAVAANPKPMALWAVLIAAAIALGLATLSLGLILAFPLIGHATWHAYRSLVSDEAVGSHG
jgi:uncharacterized membrane protein